MPPKKPKSNVTPEKVYQFLTLDELKDREQKFKSHITELRVCLNFIDDAILLVTQQDEYQLLANKWNDFVTCYPLPKPYIPADVRMFMAKLKYFENDSIRKNIDWTLYIDEHSILTQNIFRQDLTRKTLNNKIKRELGYEYDNNITNSLKVLKSIEYFLDNNEQIAKCSRILIDDIKLLKSFIRKSITEFFDRYTYRILCSEDANMRSINAITSEYSFSSDNFQIHLWCLKNVPIRFQLLEEPRLIANFHEIKLNLHIPSFMLKENLSIRAIHMNFDHISENSKSFLQGVNISTDNSKSGIQDLCDCLTHEWSMQIEIQKRIRNAMIQKRLEYEENLRILEEDQAKKKGKGKQKEKTQGKVLKKSKNVKPSKEPPIITADVYPDVWEDFLAEEQEQYGEFINTAYSPDLMELETDEINLRQYLILGGIYQLSYVRKPKHFDFKNLNMTWHQDDSKPIINNDVVIEYSKNFFKRRSTKIFQRLTTRTLSVKKELEKEYIDPKCPWFVLIIELPEYLCYWGEPIPCHYETTSKIMEEEIKEPLEWESSQKKTKNSQIQTSVKESQTLDPESLNPEYFSLLQPFNSDDPYSSVHSLTKGPKTSLSDIRLSQRENQYCARDSKGILNVYDFKITELLNQSQIRHIERHVMPRLISSFKFPKELREEKFEALQKRPKSKGGVLVRKQVNIENDQALKSESVLSYSNMQNKPERIFTIYPTTESMRIVQPILKPNLESQKPKTFYQLVNNINFIKKCYKLRVHQTLDFSPFNSKFKIANKRIIGLHKAKTTDSSTSLTNSITRIGTKIKLDIKDKLEKDKKYKDSPNVFDGLTGTSFETQASKNGSKELIKVGKEDFKTLTYNHWTTGHIFKSEYDKEKRKIVLQTDKLGYLGFAFKRYEHFPFKYWKLEPSELNPENEVVFTLETQYVRCILYISENGIRGHVTEPTTTFKRNPKMYLVIEEPIKDYKDIKKIFKEKHLNIFADRDASFYIENGYFSEKHLPTEMHTYNCMAINSTQIKYNFSQWNRLSKRRDIVLQFLQYKDVAANTVEVRITPEEASFVEISELCSDNLDVINLQYNLTWRNIDSYSDLHHLINSMYPSAGDLRCKNPKLICCLRHLLNEIRPLSFS